MGYGYFHPDPANATGILGKVWFYTREKLLAIETYKHPRHLRHSLPAPPYFVNFYMCKV
jgi:hypothetical protein